MFPPIQIPLSNESHPVNEQKSELNKINRYDMITYLTNFVLKHRD